MADKVLNGVQFIQKCLMVESDGKLLALRRASGDDFRAGCWELPGGRYEEGEDIVAAIKREIKEEVSLTVGSIRPIYLASGLNFANDLMSGKIVFASCYLSADWKGSVKISDEHTEFRWVTPEEFMTYDFGRDGGFFANSVKTYLDSLKEYEKT